MEEVDNYDGYHTVYDVGVLPARLCRNILGKIRFMPPQLREIGCHVENHAIEWHDFQHEIQFQEIGVAWIQLTQYFKAVDCRQGVAEIRNTMVQATQRLDRFGRELRNTICSVWCFVLVEMS